MTTLFDEIEKEGYIILKNLVDPNLIKEFELAARQAWGQESGQYIKQLNRQNKFLVMPKIIDVLMDSQIDYLCRMFLGDEYRYDHLLFIKGDIKNDVIDKSGSIYDIKDLHGGPYSNGGTNFYINDARKDVPFPRTGRLNIGIPFTPCNKDIGGPQILPKTHRNKDLTVYGHPKGLGGASEEWINNWRAEGNEIVIPDLDVGDILIFVDSCIHGTSHHREERMICYAMACPAFVQLTHYEVSAQKYLQHCKTDEARSRFWRPFWFNINLDDHTAINRKKMFLKKGL